MKFQEIIEDIYKNNFKETNKNKLRDLDISLSIDKNAFEYLYNIVFNLQPEYAVEVGMAWGYSSISICAALRDSSRGKSLILDPFQNKTYEGVGLKLLEKFKLNKYSEFHEERSDLFLSQLYSKNQKIQFGFIDGDHRIDAVFIDFYYINKMLSKGGIVIFDDLQFSSVTRVVKYALNNFHYELIQSNNERYAILKLIKEDDRGWDFYGDF